MATTTSETIKRGFLSWFLSGERLTLLVQALASFGVLAFIPGGLLKLVALIFLWTLTFRPFPSSSEIALFLVVSAVFTVMNALALSGGIFRFSHPDVLGMPFYELVMWGFYLLHTKRMIASPRSRRGLWGAIAYTLVFATPYTLALEQHSLLLVTMVVFVFGLVVFHERRDLASAGYMVALGTAIEYIGVISGEWSYPGSPLGRVPLWYIPMWGGVGLVLSCLLVPSLERLWPKTVGSQKGQER